VFFFINIAKNNKSEGLGGLATSGIESEQ